jgi:hypothetical protein
MHQMPIEVRAAMEGAEQASGIKDLIMNTGEKDLRQHELSEAEMRGVMEQLE